MHVTTFLAFLVSLTAIPLPVSHVSARIPVPLTMHWSHNDNPKEDTFLGVAGDSLKILLFWKNPVDSATLGKADSTLFRVQLTKPFRWHGGVNVAAGTVVPRVHRGTMADSLMLAKPAPGDSVVFRITEFRQCRKGDCSVAGMGVGVYKRTNAPAPATPSWTVTEF